MTTPRFTRGEYWLLESAVEHGWPLYTLVAEDVGLVFNKPGHGMDRDELIETLVSLFRRGLIAARDRVTSKGVYGPFAVALDRDAIEAALDEDLFSQETYYGLTSEGGRQWEAFARPDWDVFIEIF